MARSQRIRTKPGGRPGELIVQLPPGWELRVRRVLRAVHGDTLPDPREPGLTQEQRAERTQARRERFQDVMCQFVSDLITADVVGKEIAFASRGRFGTRRGSLREHVEAILREHGEVPRSRRARA